MNIQFTKALARRLRGQGITANCLHPGAIRSGFAASQEGWFGGLVRFGSGVLKSPETGAKTPVYLASDPDVAGVTGEYFYNRRLRTPSRAARNEAQSERLWAASESVVLHDPAE
jgi:NAD(P)-dependent dehydrogenase (short-subunit alcohol dehydrogenase family)